MEMNLSITGPEYTGNPELDERIDSLRREREDAEIIQRECQKEIDRIFLDAMMPFEINQGDYIIYTGEHCTTIGRVSEAYRLHDGLSIGFDLSINFIDDSSNDDPRHYSHYSSVSLNTARHPNEEYLHISRNELAGLRKSSREEFLSVSSNKIKEILSMSTETIPQNQLSLNL